MKLNLRTTKVHATGKNKTCIMRCGRKNNKKFHSNFFLLNHDFKSWYPHENFVCGGTSASTRPNQNFTRILGGKPCSCS